MLKRTSYWLVLGLMLASATCLAQKRRLQSDTLILEDFSRQWMIYDYNQKLYVPYLPDIHPPARHLHLIVQPLTWKPAYKLVLLCEKDVLLFVNNNLTRYIEQNQYVVWDLDSLAKTGGNNMLLTCVFGEPTETPPPIFLGWRRTAQAVFTPEHNASGTTTAAASGSSFFNELPSATPRPQSKQRNQLLFAALACGLVLAFFAIADAGQVSVGASIKNIVQLLKYRELQEKTNYNTLLACGVILAMLAAYLLLTAASYGVILPESVIFFDKNRPGESYFSFFVGVLSFLAFKYALIRFLENVFEHRLLAEKHIALNMNIYKIFILLTFVAFLAYQMSNYSYLRVSPQILAYLLFWGWTGATIITGVMLYFSVKHSFVYLIAYLCSVEVLPLLLVLKSFLIPS